MVTRSRFRLITLVCMALLLPTVVSGRAAPVLNPASTAYQPLPFLQDWSDVGLITTDEDWSGVPGITGYRGDGLTSNAGTDPQTVTAEGFEVVDANANQTSPNSFSTGGVTEFLLANPVVALSGSGTADAPFLLLNLDTLGFQFILVAYNLYDLDGSQDNAVQPVALQYRIGETGPFINLPDGFVADASDGPSLAGRVTPVGVLLPAAADNQPQVQVRIITTNAVGNDEWIGVDDIGISGLPLGSDWPPLVTTTSPGNYASRVALDANITVDFSEPVDVIDPWFYLGCSVSGDHPATYWGGPHSFTLDPIQDFSNDETCTVIINAAGVKDKDTDDPPDSLLTYPTWSFSTLPKVDLDACGAAYTPVYTLQGSGSASPLDGSEISTEGIVVGDFQAAGQLKGFFLQDPSGDGDPATSDGIFMYTPSGPEVAPGDRVRVKGKVDEFNGLTEISPVLILTVCETGLSLPAVAIDLPFADAGALEAYEGMLVTFPEALTVSEHSNLGRHGEVTVSAGGRLFQPASDQGSSQDLNNRSRLLLDDGSNMQNPATVPYLGADDTLRLGDTVAGLTGVIDYSFSQYRLQPTRLPDFQRANPRPAAPEETNGSLKIASFNVLTYFNGDGQGGGFPTSRGADNQEEFQRQREKIIAALIGLDADVVGLIEIENDGAGEFSALADLVNGLNAATSPGTYDLIEEPAPGSNAIKVSLIYKPAMVTPLGAAQNYQATSNTYGDLFDRPPLAQAFIEKASGETFTVVVNHFKSKTSCPGTGPDADQGDGQGCWNAKRILQAQELLKFLESLQKNDPDVLVMGDFNAYAQEDPLDTLLSGGLSNPVAQFVPLPNRYSYVYDGQSGSLDHALATSEIAPKVTGAAIWHINADEPSILDYNTESNPAWPYHPDAFRSSDHDPILIGLRLSKEAQRVYLPWVNR